MGTPLRLLILEDNSSDAELVLHALRRSGYDPTAERVETEVEYLHQLQLLPEIILADFSMPQFDSLRALEIMQELRLDIPFIIVSGTIGEDRAVEVMQRGATDYVIKDRLGRLGDAVKQALSRRQLKNEKLQAERDTIAEQRRHLEELRSSEQRFRNLVMALPAAVYTTDSNGLITLFNEHAVELWGRRPELGKDRWAGAWRTYHPDGTPLPADQIPLAVMLREGSIVCGEEAILERPDGSQVHVLSHPEPLRDASGDVVGAVDMLVDITQMKQLEAQFRQSQKMDAVGQLAAGVAHDFNNLLTIILGYSGLFLETLPLDHPERDWVVQIRDAGRRAATLTHQLLAFGRKQVLMPVVLDLNSLVSELEKMLRRLIGEDIELSTMLDPSLGWIRADTGQVEQVIINLIVNARDAMPLNGRLTIQTKNTTLNEMQFRKNPELASVPYTLLTVSDTGSGMDAATISRIFDPFYTTKEIGKGTGLGLSTVFGIVKQSGGFIEVDSDLGAGSTFRVYFPQFSETHPLDVQEQPPALMPCGWETILLVEDEDELRQFAKIALESVGYKVVCARNGSEAIRICFEYADEIHLLLTDIVMPKMSGRQLVDVLVPSRTEMKVLYVSGYTDDTIMRHGIRDAQVNLLAKPFTPEALTGKVREVLDEPPLPIPDPSLQRVHATSFVTI